MSAIYRGVRGSLLCSGALDPEALVSRRSFSLGLPPGRAKTMEAASVRKWQAKIPDMSRIFVKINAGKETDKGKL